jgi:hypothetical protein
VSVVPTWEALQVWRTNRQMTLPPQNVALS